MKMKMKMMKMKLRKTIKNLNEISYPGIKFATHSWERNGRRSSNKEEDFFTALTLLRSKRSLN